MSFWHEIEDKEDVDTSEDFTELHILYKYDLQGNYYVSVPVEFVLEALGVEGQSPSDDKGSEESGGSGVKGETTGGSYFILQHFTDGINEWRDTAISRPDIESLRPEKKAMEDRLGKGVDFRIIERKERVVW